VPVEVTESITPIVVWRKELRADSGGAGRQRGGLGQIMEVSNREDSPMGIFHRFERVKYPARGRAGGKDGATGRLQLQSGKEFPEKGLHIIPPGDRIIIEMPGGGGYGDPTARDPNMVARDVEYGLISERAAREIYGKPSS
jgi:N-methylhydantoinase B